MEQQDGEPAADDLDDLDGKAMKTYEFGDTSFTPSDLKQPRPDGSDGGGGGAGVGTARNGGGVGTARNRSGVAAARNGDLQATVQMLTTELRERDEAHKAALAARDEAHQAALEGMRQDLRKVLTAVGQSGGSPPGRSSFFGLSA